jgi:hypothetical protein
VITKFRAPLSHLLCYQIAVEIVWTAGEGRFSGSLVPERSLFPFVRFPRVSFVPGRRCGATTNSKLLLPPLARPLSSHPSVLAHPALAGAPLPLHAFVRKRLDWKYISTLFPPLLSLSLDPLYLLLGGGVCFIRFLLLPTDSSSKASRTSLTLRA